MRLYVTPKEIRQKLDRYTAYKRTEGSPQRSKIGTRMFHDLADGRSCIVVYLSMGKIKTIRMPEWQGMGWGFNAGRG
jgi:hypothetical protein